MTLHLTRDSVCMGDDVLAPNPGTLDLPPDTPLPELLGRITRARYLASVAGGATWSLWHGPNLLATLHIPGSGTPQIHLATNVAHLQVQDLDLIHFRYHCAANPVAVLANPAIRA